MESEKKDIETKFCISPEKLSAKLDGEYKFTAAEKKHFDECVLCRNLYDSYALMSRKLTRAIAVDYPEEVHAKIKKTVLAAVRAKEKKSAKTYFCPTRLVRIAATLVFFGGAAFLLMQVPEIRNSRNAENRAMEEKIVVQYDPREAVLSAPAEPLKEDPLAGAVDIRNTRLSSTDPGISFLTPENASPVRKAVVIPDFVKQVWLYPAALVASAAAENLRKDLQKNGIDLKKVKLSVPDANTVRAEISLDKRQLVLLVRELSRKKYKLLSGTPPQPEQTLFLGSGKDPVTSEIVLMRHSR